MLALAAAGTISTSAIRPAEVRRWEGNLHLECDSLDHQLDHFRNLVTGGPGGGWEQYTWVLLRLRLVSGYGGGEGSGGGLYYGGSSGSLALANDTISNNFASGGNGGYQGYAQYGGPDQIISEGSGGASVGGGIAVATGSASAMFVNDTIAGNSSTGGIGGGYWNYAQFNGEWPPEPITSLEFQAATYGGPASFPAHPL